MSATRLKLAQEHFLQIQGELERARKERMELIKECHYQVGMTIRDIATTVGLSQQRVYQLLHAQP